MTVSPTVESILGQSKSYLSPFGRKLLYTIERYDKLLRFAHMSCINLGGYAMQIHDVLAVSSTLRKLSALAPRERVKSQHSRVTDLAPFVVNAHCCPCMPIFLPFVINLRSADDSMVASCSIDNTVIVWRMPAASSGQAGAASMSGSLSIAPFRTLRKHKSFVKVAVV